MLMYQVNENSLQQLETINEQMRQVSSLLEKLRLQSGLKSADYRQRIFQLQDSDGPQVQLSNHLWTLENRLEELKERRQEICLSLLDYLLALPGQSRKDFALEYYFHGISNIREIAHRIGLSPERTYHLHREVRQAFAALLKERADDRRETKDSNQQQCAD